MALSASLQTFQGYGQRIVVEFPRYHEVALIVGEPGGTISFGLTQAEAEKLAISLGSVLVTLRGIQKKLTLRERIRASLRALVG